MWLVTLLTIIFHSNFRNVDTLADSAGVVLLPLPSAPTPEFSGPIQNVTAAVGREAVLTCTVTELGHYKVGWMKADDQTILSLHTRVITHNPRISVTHDDNFRTWQLRIRQLKESDRGCYMCQINTSSMRKQLGCIDVQVSPDIDDTETSTDFTVTEGENVTLVCKATGHPQPRILWRREDGDKLILHTGTHQTEKADTYSGSQLLLLRVERHQMGAYLCIASNDVPPTVSKRIMLNINFAPKLHVPRGLVGAPLNADAKLKCEVEAYPHSNNYWLKNGEDVLKSGYRYKVQEKRSGYKTTMVITIFNISHYDFGTYKCSASNSMGESDDTVRLYEVKIPTTTITTITTKVFYLPEITTFQNSPTPTISTSSSTIDLERSLKEDPSEDWLFPPSVVPAPLEFETHSSATSLSACTTATLVLVIITIR